MLVDHGGCWQVNGRTMMNQKKLAVWLNMIAKTCLSHSFQKVWCPVSIELRKTAQHIPILSVPIPGGQFHCLALSQTCPNSRMMGVLLSFLRGKKTSGKENLGGGAVGSPRPEAEARPTGGVGTTQLSILDSSSCLEPQLGDGIWPQIDFQVVCIGRKSAIWETWVGEIWSLSLPDVFSCFSSAFICYSISKNPRLSMEQPLQFRILYTNCLWSSNLFWLIQTHGTKTRHRYTQFMHISRNTMIFYWPYGRSQATYALHTDTHLYHCGTVSRYYPKIACVWSVWVFFSLNVWTYHPYLEDYLVDQHSSGGLKPPSTCTSAPLSSRPLVGPHTQLVLSRDTKCTY